MRRSFWFRRWVGAVREISGHSHGEEVVGIDLGSTNSRVAVLEELIPTVVESESGRAIPSFVAFNKEEVLVGQTAKDHAIAYPENSLFKIKNLLGRKFNDPQTQKLKGIAPYEIVEGLNGEALIKVGVKLLSPTEVCASILCKLKEAAQRHLLKLVSKAVITVPVHFNDVQRREIEAAGKNAGLDVLRIIDEPIAAAISSFKKINNGVVAVLDMGGGTFAVSILEISNGVIKVVARTVDPFLGGEDFDHAIVQYLVKEIRRTHSVDVSGDRITLMRLLEAAEKAKMELSSSTYTDIYVPYISATGSFPIHLDITLTRMQFENIVWHLFERAKNTSQKCLKDAGEIDDVILVGGMAKVPRVQQMVVEILGRAPNVEMDSLEAVVVGAAIQGGFIIEDEKEAQPNVIPLSVGVDTLGGVFTRIINRNTRMPTKASRSFSTEADNQRSICLRILQGERKMSADNKIIGELEFVDIPPAPQGIPRILVTFNVDANGILSASAKNIDTGTEKAIIVQLDTEIANAKKAVKEAMLNGIRDEKVDLVKARVFAVSYINKMEKFLNMKNKVIPTEHRERIEAALNDLRVVMYSNNVLAIKWKIIVARWAGTELYCWENFGRWENFGSDEGDDD